MASTNLDALIPYVRLKTGDMNSESYRYVDSWLQTALIASVDTLSRWWNFKYLLDNDNNIYRNPNYTGFIFDESTYGIIEQGDEQIIVLMASIIVLQGSLQDTAWDFVSWRDAEVSFSNLESSRARSGILGRLWDELLYLMKPPVKRLARPVKGSLPGYRDNEYETGNINNRDTGHITRI